jgi:indole-3-glycerol phosphate synthase
MTKGILNNIAVSVLKRVVERKKMISIESLKSLERRIPHDFSTCFLPNKVSIIAEIKFKSPSEGTLGASINLEETASSYLKGGASALSVLTEQDYFNGSLEYLNTIRLKHPSSFLLMKDFIVDEYQIFEGVQNGADCILLILSLLGFEKAKAFSRLAKELGLSVLVEVHNEKEMEMAIEMNAKIIGVNNRNLDTLKTSLDVSRSLIKLAPKNTFLICESGIDGPDQIREMRSLGFNGFLIGTSLMRTPDPKRALIKLIEQSS